MSKLSPQVEKSLYYGPGYINPARFASYSRQISEILKLEPQSVLEIGIGNGIVSYMLKKAGLDVTTLDFDESLEPDIVASVTDMPLPDNAFDVVACYEVLEHLPFEMFQPALKQIHRVTKRYAVISLPDCGRFYKIEFCLPKIGRRRFAFELPLGNLPEHEFTGEHYWEINKKGYPLQTVRDAMRLVGFCVEKTYRLWEYPYHRFFVLEKRVSP